MEDITDLTEDYKSYIMSHMNVFSTDFIRLSKLQWFRLMYNDNMHTRTSEYNFQPQTPKVYK